MSRPRRSVAVVRDHAAVAFSYAADALSDLEKVECDDDEILRLCDEVIRRRVRLQLAELDAGRRLSAGVLAQLNRDRILLNDIPGDGYRGDLASPWRP